uniref:glycosyltransferase family 2 protein n=1 Tax=Candidatus Pelagibacter sp. TaxID=2024849 RepID=UPI003F843842
MNIYEDITLIMVTYRSEELIKKNLDILKNFKLIIVDNSNSNKLKTIVENFKNIKVIISEKNLGYGKAANLGISYAKTPLILTINPDLLITEDGVKKLTEVYLENIDNVGILSPSLYDNNFKRRTNGDIGFINQLKGKKVSNKTNNYPEGNTCCEFLIGCCYLINRNLFLDIGGFDENFFMYYEDNDLCDRIKKKGKYNMEVPSVKFIHLENSSTKKNIFTNSKLAIIHKISCYLYIKKNS